MLVRAPARFVFCAAAAIPRRSAVIYSILISCRRRGLNPEEYLTDVLARLPSMKIHQIHELLPGQWTPPSANTS